MSRATTHDWIFILLDLKQFCVSHLKRHISLGLKLYKPTEGKACHGNQKGEAWDSKMCDLSEAGCLVSAQTCWRYGERERQYFKGMSLYCCEKMLRFGSLFNSFLSFCHFWCIYSYYSYYLQPQNMLLLHSSVCAVPDPPRHQHLVSLKTSLWFLKYILWHYPPCTGTF